MSNTEIHKLLLYAAGGLAVLAAIVALAATVFGKRAEEDKSRRSATSGVLAPAPPASQSPFPYPEVEIGDSGAVFLAGAPDGVLFRFARDNSLTVELDPKGRVLVSLGIRDRTGALVAELAKNEWKVNPGRAWDRNYSTEALEVKDASGQVVLQVRVKGRRVQLQARLYDEHGNGVGLVKALGPDGKVGGMMEKTGPNSPLTRLIDPLFRYPSDLHFGQLR